MTKDNLMQSAHAAPRCTATSKRSGKRCKAPAVRGWTVCRMHGARGGAPQGPAHGMYLHGAYTMETDALAKVLAMLKRVKI